MHRDLQPQALPTWQRLQRFVFDPSPERAELYVRRRGGHAAPGHSRGDRYGVPLPAGREMSCDTYFNSFYERHWRRHAGVSSVALAIRGSGTIRVRVYRSGADLRPLLLVDDDVTLDAGEAAVPIPPAGERLPQAGRLHVELRATTQARIDAMAWTTDAPIRREARLALVFCTFNRERELADVLHALAADEDALDAVACIVIVNQGDRELAASPALRELPAPVAARLVSIRQDNFGGAGGFTRGMLEATARPDITHVVLMDDDIRLESESVYRAARFFAFAPPDVALAGQMLDGLKPTELYEGGAVVDRRRLALAPLHQYVPLTSPRKLDALVQPDPVHYGGWWFHGFPVALVERIGFPLPCFIRGDDVEYGLRIHGVGATTASLPGIAVWHEPFYVKLGSWQYYYEVRNMLVAAALHFDRSPVATAVQLLKWSLAALLTFQYAAARLLLRAVDDYLRGPGVLRGPPQPIHAELKAAWADLPRGPIDALRVVPAYRPPPPPTTNLRMALRLARYTLHNLLVPARGGPMRMQREDFVWFQTGRLDRIALENRWEANLVPHERSPRRFRELFGRTLAMVLRFPFAGPRAAREWRDARDELVSREGWSAYLGEPPRIVAVIVTRDRPALLARCLDRIAQQTVRVHDIIVVDNASDERTARVVEAFGRARHLRLDANTGAAYAFGVGIRTALEDGATHVWMMDDDGHPGSDDVLGRLVATMREDSADIAAPLVLDERNPDRLAFALQMGRRRVFERKTIAHRPRIVGFAHFFNGPLVAARVFDRIGLPDPRLFIRGDEIEFYFRCLRAGVRIVLDTHAIFLHPSGQGEIHRILFGIAYAVVPPEGPKRHYQFRNRGFVFRKYGLWQYLIFDFMRYGVYFLVNRRLDVRGYRDWFRSMSAGFRGRLDDPPAVSPTAAARATATAGAPHG